MTYDIRATRDKKNSYKKHRPSPTNKKTFGNYSFGPKFVNPKDTDDPDFRSGRKSGPVVK